MSDEQYKLYYSIEYYVGWENDMQQVQSNHINIV